MQLQHKDHNVRMGPMAAKKEFTVRVGAHIMAILSGMYKDPKEAVVREYLSNMYDAYVPLMKAGVTNLTPPVLRLPTKLNPTIEFQDFGVGMDYETVWNVYAEYGNSTKSTSNDEIGAFGIGSKTAFCYNNGAPWNITATKNGITNHFMAFVGKDGIPQLTHVGEERTKHPNGVTVSIPVRHQDVEEFQVAALKFIPYFPMKLEVTGIADVPGKREYLLQGFAQGMPGIRWGVLNSGHSQNSTRLVMGNIPYRVEDDNIRRDVGLSDDQYRFFVYSSIDIFINIGDVDIVPSRDALKWTDRTKQFVGKVLKAVYKDVTRAINEKIAKCVTQWEAMTALRDLRHEMNFNIGTGTILWNGLDLEKPIKIPLSELRALGVTLTNVSSFSITDTDKATPEVATPTELVLQMRPVTPSYSYGRRQRSLETATTVIIVNDLGKSIAGLARGYIRNNYTNKTHRGRVARYGHTVSTVYAVETKASVDKIATALRGFNHIVKASSLVGSVAEVKAEAKTGLYRWNGKSSFDARVNIPSGESTYYYVPVEKLSSGRFGYAASSAYNLYDTMRSLLEACNTLNITLPTGKSGNSLVYGVKLENIDDLDTEWIDLSALVKTKALAYIDSHKEVIADFRANKQLDTLLRDFIRHAIPDGVPGYQKTLKDVNVVMDLSEKYRAVERDMTLFANSMAISTDKKCIMDAFAAIKPNSKNDLKVEAQCKEIIAFREGFTVAYDMFRFAGYRDSASCKKILTPLTKKH